MDEEKRKIHDLVSDFSDKMREKLVRKCDEDWSGWDDPHNRCDLEQALMAHVVCALQGSKRQWLDVANFAAFLDAMESADAGDGEE